MEVRDADPADADDFRWIARSSMREAYGAAISPTAIDTAVEDWYEEERVVELVEDPTHQCLVAEESGTVIGFLECHVSDNTEEATIAWVHVDPEHWEDGVGDRLLSRAETNLFEAGVSRIEGRALLENEDVVSTFEDRGYIEGTDRETTVGEETFTERSYLLFSPEEEPRLIEARETESGTFYIALDDHKVGSRGDFYVAYTDEDRESRYGFYCNHCLSVDASMDTMGRVQCNNCGNTAKPTRWDAAYL